MQEFSYCFKGCARFGTSSKLLSVGRVSWGRTVFLAALDGNKKVHTSAQHRANMLLSNYLVQHVVDKNICLTDSQESNKGMLGKDRTSHVLAADNCS